MINTLKNYKKRISNVVKKYDTRRILKEKELTNRNSTTTNMIYPYKGSFSNTITETPTWIEDLNYLFIEMPKKVSDTIIDALDGLSDEVLKAIGYFTGSTCKKMEGKVAVGVIFIESSIDGGPKFKSTDKIILLSNLYKAHSYLTNKKPEPKNLSWYYDIQNIKIEEEDRGRGINSLSDNYFKYEAMKKVVYNGKTFFGNILGVDNYLDLLKSDKKCDYSVMYFITPYSTSFSAYTYAYNGTSTLSSAIDNYAGWGIYKTDKILAHETCHLFGAQDEYPGSNRSCTTTSGCNKVPNANFKTCCSPKNIKCLMFDSSDIMCYSTRGQIGWINSYIKLEITTGTDLWSGTDSDIFIKFGKVTEQLKLSFVNAFENGSTNTYYLWNSNITKDLILDKFTIELKPILGFVDNWKLSRIKIWYLDTLIRDLTPDIWFEKSNLTWTASKVNINEKNNFIKLEITTGTDWFAGTDNNIYFDLSKSGGNIYQLDSPNNDFENGDTGTYIITSQNQVSLKKEWLNNFSISLSPYNILKFADDWKLAHVKIWWNSDIFGEYSPNIWLTKENPSWTYIQT